MLNAILSPHALNDRVERLTYIHDTVGFGDRVEAEWFDGNKVLQLTDTGVVMVKGATDDMLVTAYIATLAQAIRIYYNGLGLNMLPRWLYKRVTRNQQFYKEQPHIQNVFVKGA